MGMVSARTWPDDPARMREFIRLIKEKAQARELATAACGGTVKQRQFSTLSRNGQRNEERNGRNDEAAATTSAAAELTMWPKFDSFVSLAPCAFLRIWFYPSEFFGSGGS
jgi:hypothetical protein